MTLRKNGSPHFGHRNKQHSNSGGHSNSYQGGKPGGGQHRQSTPNRHHMKRAPEKTVQLWLNPPSQTLTSHISVLEKRNGRDQQPFRKHGQNGGDNSGFQGQHSNGRHDQGRNHQSPGRNFNPRRQHQPHHQGHQQHQRRPFRPEDAGQSSAAQETGVNAAAPANTAPSAACGNINPFDLFCAYHLGIGPNNTYRPANINQVAQRFGVDPATIRQATKECGFDSNAMLDKDFDLALAQLDIQVAPEGVSRVELAKSIYDEFLKAPVNKRDWNKLLQEDRKENLKVFGS